MSNVQWKRSVSVKRDWVAYEVHEIESGDQRTVNGTANGNQFFLAVFWKRRIFRPEPRGDPSYTRSPQTNINHSNNNNTENRQSKQQQQQKVSSDLSTQPFTCVIWLRRRFRCVWHYTLHIVRVFPLILSLSLTLSVYACLFCFRSFVSVCVCVCFMRLCVILLKEKIFFLSYGVCSADCAAAEHSNSSIQQPAKKRIRGRKDIYIHK